MASLLSFLLGVQKSCIVSALNSGHCQYTETLKIGEGEKKVISAEKLKCTELHFDFVWKTKMAAICGVYLH